jgi:hypothetical protein
MRTLLTLFALPPLGLRPPAFAAAQGKVYGGVAGIACPSGQYCVRVPEVCTQVHRPVCGCNGRTYSNH